MVNLDYGKIRELMSGHGMSKRDLAYRLGVSEGLLKAILDRGTAKPDFARRISEALSVSIVEITCA